MSLGEKAYDVFISSFRGDEHDSLRNFISHLHSALCGKGIKELGEEEDVWPAVLSKAIEESRAAVVVFSENHASSKWCLEELLKILECREKEGQLVIPVFFQVDPSDIRLQTGTNESQVIEKIVEDVLQKLELRFPNELKVKNLIGFDKIYEHVKLLLSKNKSENVQVIGIWGMAGIGKTTIAKALFSELLPHYDSVYFMKNVREEASQYTGQSKLTSLREKLLSELLKDEHINSATFTERRLSSKKILVVLDNVDSSEQLEVLCEEYSHAGPGSKIIITTRNKHLLRGIVDEDDVYEVTAWSPEESLELFCLSAFGSKHPKEGYEDLSYRAVCYAGGVPLVLKVLGSNLRDKSTEIWDNELIILIMELNKFG